MTEFFQVLAIVLACAAILMLRANARLKQRLHARLRELEESHAAQLQHAREERDRLVDALGDAFLLVDDTSHIRFANARARSLFRGRKLVGRSVMEAFMDERLAVALMKCLRTGEPAAQHVVLPQQTSPLGDDESRGVNAWVIDAAPLSGGPGGQALTRVVLRDVTSEHQTEQVRKDFVANASHELRTPLAIIGGYLENLIDDGLIEDRDLALRFLQVMRKHADRISRIVEDMLVISRLESGETAALNVKPFPFLSCVNDVLERLELVIRHQQATVDLHLPDQAAAIEGDRFYWTQVLFNLVENALKQNPREGLRIEIGCEHRDDGMEIWVADDGVGIPSADLPFIFKRFYRVEKHHSQEEIKGTGLGLSIVKRAIEAHGGEISVSSVPGEETRFTIRLPRDLQQLSDCAG